MRRPVVLACLAVAAVAGAGIQAWGSGAFWPCESLGRLFGSGRCTRILTLDGRSLQGLDRLPNGNLLAAARGHGPDPDKPLALIEIDPARGTILAETKLPAAAGAGIPAKASIGQVAVDGAGSLVALTALDMPTTLVDRQGRVKAVFDRVLPGFVAFDPQGSLLLEMGRNPGGIPDVASTQVFDPAAPGAAPSVLAGKPPPGMFATGVQTALSGDGRLFAQGVGTKTDSGIATVRLGSMTNRAEPGSMLTAPLREGCNYILPRLAFSPDSRRLAAAFQCPARWGTDASALLIWDLVQGRVLARIPTEDDWRAPFWLDNETVLVTRYDPGRRRAELFAIRF